MSTTRIRHMIEVTPDRGTPLIFEFQSRDIGATQGSTVWHGETLVGTFRPGTRYWDTALEIASRLLAKTVDAAPLGEPHWHETAFPARFAAILAADRYSPWDGTDPDWD